jgi:hypothetical protein
VVSLNLLCCLINKKTNYKCCGSDISLCKNSSKKRGIVCSLFIKCCKCEHSADIMASNITRRRLRDNNTHFVHGLRSFGKG